ncbi:MAG TPA: kelch repeat-containing protein [Gaiellaceae bacterium]|nr:kelch repeat-containing protein [Gaiellaceae bacterium]
MRVALAAALVIGVAASLASAAAPPRWTKAAPVPLARTEVAAVLAANEIYVIGGYTQDGHNSARVDAYSPRTNRWRRLPDLPITVDHTMAAAYRGRVYVVGGYGGEGHARMTTLFVLAKGAWTTLTPMPEQRAAGGAAVVNGKLYVVGGTTSATIGAPRAANDLATATLVYDIARDSWSRAPGPTKREHLGVTALNGIIYAVGGRLGGADTNMQVFESFTPSARAWRRLAPVPGRRGGTAVAATGRTIVSVGGETPTETIRTAYAYNTRTRRWRRLPNLPTPRHGLGAVAFGKRIYVLGGGRQPGLGGVSGVNEVLALP